MATTSIYDRFHLLPPPPPTIFSRQPASVRMRLPDFETVPDAQAFLDKMFIWQHSKAMTVARIVSACLSIALLLVCIGIKIPQYIQKRLWLFRLVQTSRGTIILPCVNALFSVFGSTFLLLNSTFVFLEVSSFDRKSPKPIENFVSWMIFHFIPLWCAAYAQAWSNAFGRVPGSRHYELSFHPRFRRDTLSPLATNTLWIASPVVLLSLLAIPTCRSNALYEQARHGREAWLVRFGNASELSDDLLVDIQRIWQDLQQSFCYLTICFILWTVIAMGEAVLYAFLSSRLIRQLHVHLAALLHLKHSREIVPTVRIENITVVTIGPADKVSGLPLHCKSPERAHCVSYMNHTTDQRQDVRLFPPVAPGATWHKALGDGHSFQSVLRIYSAQSIIFVVASFLYGAISLTVGLLLVDALERNEIERLESWGLFLAQMFAFLMGLTLTALEVFLDKSDAFLALMHGDYHQGIVKGVSSSRSASRSALVLSAVGLSTTSLPFTADDDTEQGCNVGK
ncbi:hypothetical protein OC844_001308 [Tilletia horrida]|nr:hypothetical protein OC844_001308 [Tilletia horrida]